MVHENIDDYEIDPMDEVLQIKIVTGTSGNPRKL